MDLPTFDRRRLPSRCVTEGPGRASHRSYEIEMGLGDYEARQRVVRVATGWNEGEVIVIRKEGLVAGSGMGEVLAATEPLHGHVMGKRVALISDRAKGERHFDANI